MSPLINILIRNKYRPELFHRCIDSIASQTYKNIRVIVCHDNEDAARIAFEASVKLIAQDIRCEVFPVQSKPEGVNYWNLYCNELKDRAQDGFYLYVDDDDRLASPTVLQELSQFLFPDHGLIVQFLRNGVPKPNSFLMAKKRIERGRIGGSCIVLHHSHKNLANWQPIPGGDFFYIKEVEKHIPLKFVPMVVVAADQKNNGK